MRKLMNISGKSALALCLAASLAGGAWWLSPAAAQQQPPVVVQVPNGSAAASAQPVQKGETFFQTAGEVSFENGEGAITATLGDLLRTSDAAGLEKVRITGRARNVSGSGTSIGQILWTAVTVDDGGEKKTAPLAAPLSSQFKIQGKALSAGTKIKAEGDLSGVITAAKSLVHKAKAAEKKDDKSKAPAAAAAPAATGGQGAANDIAKNYTPLAAPAPAPAATVAPPEPTLTLTSNGCTPRVDAQGGFVVIQSQTLSNGAPMSTGCTDTAERIPIQKSYTGCPDLISGAVAQPQFKQFWVATNGTTNFIGDCQPDPDTKYNITSDTSGCTSAANLTSMTWDVYAQQVYLNHNNVKVVVSSCAVSTSTVLQVGKDYKSCTALVDLTTGIVSPEFKAWYVNPITNQQQAYTTCQADLAAAVAIQKDYAACPAIVGATTAQRQYQAWYTDTTGARVNYGSCAPDLNSSMVIQTTSTGCSDYVDQSQMKAFTQVRSFYFDATGASVPVKDCAPDPAQSFALVNDYTACPAVINSAAGFAEDVGQLYYMNAVNARVTFGSCTPDPNRLYVIKQDFSSCTDKVDIPNLKAYAQFKTYYLDVAGVNHPVDQQCQPQSDAFQINADTSVCTYAVDMSQHTAQEQGQLYYLDRLSARIMVRDCSPTAKPPIAVTPNTAACSLRTDFTNMIAIQQEAWQFTDTIGSVHNVTSCVDSTITYPITNIYGVCPDLVLSDKSAAFKQVRSQITGPSGPQYLTDCAPSQAPSDTATPTTTVSGCETTFFNYIDQGQSYGAWRYVYQFAGGEPVYLTSCVQSTTVYPHQVEIQGYLYNDPQKTAQPKTDIYINTPVGRVDVSPAQVRAGAANVAYLYERETNNARPASMFWVGCEAWQPTDKTDTYLRPDNTEVSYLVGAGPNVDMGDQCTRTTQTQTIYAYAYADAAGYVYSAAVPGGVAAGPGTVSYGVITSCVTYSAGTTMTVTNYYQQQTRTVTTLPAGAGGTSSYGAWANTGGAYASGAAVCYGPDPNGGH